MNKKTPDALPTSELLPATQNKRHRAGDVGSGCPAGHERILLGCPSPAATSAPLPKTPRNKSQTSHFQNQCKRHGTERLEGWRVAEHPPRLALAR